MRRRLNRPTGDRGRWFVLVVVLVAFLAFQLFWSPTSEANRADIWWLVVSLIVPDLAFLLSIGPGLERGQIHPRAVTAYNLLHALWLGPVLLLAGGLLLPDSPLTIAGLGWGLHIAIDRAVGFGPRDPSGFIRH